MTIDQLVELDADAWDKLDDAALMEIFKPFLNVTRPELARAQRPKTHTASSFTKTKTVELSDAKQRALAMLASEGLDMGFMNKLRFRKK